MHDWEFLEGFEKRMQILAAIDSIVSRRNRNMEIESLFEYAQLDNIILSVLVFIMERTLAEDEQCTLDRISSFLGGILPAYGLDPDTRTRDAIAEYIVKDILQNGGEARYYPVMKYGQGLTTVRIRLIDDKLEDSEEGYLVSYQLTNQGYDLLFRTKEVEDEISFTIEELKLRELIKRKNYKKAINQSANLRQMIRQKRNDISQFVERTRSNILDVDIGEFEQLVNSTYALLEEEYGIMNEIRDMVELSEQRLREEENARGNLDEEMKRARREISLIRRNIISTIEEQKQVILERHHLSGIYKDMIQDSFTLSLARIYDFEREILEPLEKCHGDAIIALWQLLNPLFKPGLYKNLNLLSFYEHQARIRLEDEDVDGLTVEVMAEDIELLKTKRINDANIELIRALLKWAGRKGEAFRFSEFYADLQGHRDLHDQVMAEELLFKSMLKLYDLGTINIAAWQMARDQTVANATGELDISYCLHSIEYDDPDLYGVKRLEIKKPDENVFTGDVNYLKDDIIYQRHIVFSDLLIEVYM